MNGIIMVGIGGALGSIARYLCTLGMAQWLGEKFPWGTLFVNVTGSFVIGFFFHTHGGGRAAVDRSQLAHLRDGRHLRGIHDVFLA